MGNVVHGGGSDKTQTSGQARGVWLDHVLVSVMEMLRKLMETVRPDEGEDLGGIDGRVRTMLRALGGFLLEACALRAAEDLPRPVCCGRPMHVTHRRPRDLQGVTGDCRAVRTEYVCTHCGQHCVPADTFWGVGPGQYSPLMAQLVCRMGAEIPSFDRAAAMTREALGTPVCADTVARTCQAVGAVAEQEQQQAMEIARQLTAPAAQQVPAQELPEHLAVIRNALTVPVVDTASMIADQSGEQASSTRVPTLLCGVDATKALADRRWRDVKVGVVAPLGPPRRSAARGTPAWRSARATTARRSRRPATSSTASSSC